MKKNLAALLIFSSVLLSGCATLSFAPPAVRGDKSVTNDGKCPPKVDAQNAAISQNAEGALRLVENYRLAYWCADRELADGRQWFEVPSALALAGGVTAAAFGAGPGVAIGTGAGAATLGHGNKYYAAKEKAHIVAAAYDAVICIKQEASGITALTIQASETKTTQNKLLLAAAGVKPSVSFSPEFQYYQQVSSALENTGSILAERLSSVGSYAPDAIAKEITELAKEAQGAKSDAAKGDATQTAKSLTAGGAADQAIIKGIIELAELQARLKLCVVRAKAG